MRFGLDISQHQLSWEELVARARLAEDAGARRRLGVRPLQGALRRSERAVTRGVDALGGLARETSRVRLGTLVTGMTHRNPSVLAAEVVTVDHLSGGRVECAIGAAWNEPEHRELGIPFPPTSERLDRLEEGIQVLRLLFTEEDVTFDGRSYQLEGATYRPEACAATAPADLVGGEGRKRTLPIVGRFADAWHGWASDATELAALNAIIDGAAEEAGQGSRLDPPRVKPLDLRAMGRSEGCVRVDAGWRDRLPRHRLADGGTRQTRGVPRAHPAYPVAVGS